MEDQIGMDRRRREGTRRILLRDLGERRCLTAIPAIDARVIQPAMEQRQIVGRERSESDS